MQGKHFTLPAVLGLLAAAARARAAFAERRCRSRPRPRQFAWISQSQRRRRWKVVCLSSFHTKEHRVGAQTQHNNLHTQSLMFCSQSVGGGGGFFNPWVALLLVNIGSMGINLNALAHSLCHYIATSPLVHGLLSRPVPSPWLQSRFTFAHCNRPYYTAGPLLPAPPLLLVLLFVRCCFGQ